MSFDEQHLRIENVRLREEVTKTTPSVTLINSNFVILQLVFNI